MTSKWTRSMTSKMGIEIDEFVKGLKAALSDTSVARLLQQTITEPLHQEIAQLKETINKKNQQIENLEKQLDKLEQYT